MNNLSISLVIGASVGTAIAGIREIRANLATLRNDTLTSTEKIALLGRTSVASFTTLGSGVMAVGTSMMAFSQSAIKFESSMADIAKVVDGLKDSTGKTTEEYGKMSKEILDMSSRLPMAANDIAKIYAAGGQSGIARQDLSRFAESAVKMGVAFDISAEQSGQAMAELRSAFSMGQAEVETLADKINYLGNTTPAAAKGIMEIVQRVGAFGTVAGYNTGTVAALGATMRGFGIQEEVAATSIKNMMLAMVTGDTATKSQIAVWKKLGFNHKQVAKDMQTDAEATTLKVLESISKLEKHDQASTLKELFGSESLLGIAPLLQNLNAVKDNLKKVADESKYAGSMQQEYEARAATTENNIQLLKNSLEKIRITLGSALLPVINKVINQLKPFFDNLTTWIENNQDVVASMIKVGIGLTGLVAGLLVAKGVIAGLLAIFIPFRSGITLIAKTAGTSLNVIRGHYGLLSTALRLGLPVRGILNAVNTLRGLNILARLGTVFNVLKNGALIAGRAMLFLGRALLMNPIGLAITAIAVGAYLIYRYWQPIKGFFIGVWQGIKTAFAPVGAFFSGLAQGLMIGLAPLKPLVMGVVNLFVSAWSGLKNIVSAVFEGIATVIGLIGGRIVEIVSGFVDVLGVVWQGLITILQPVIDLFGRAFDGIATSFSGLWQSVQSFIQPIITAISDFFNITEAGSRSTGEMIGLVLGGAITGLVNIFSSSISAIVSLFSGGISHLISTILSFSPVGLFSQILSGLSPYISMVWESIKALFSGGVSNLSATILSFSPVSLFAQVFAGVSAFFSGLVGSFSEYGRNLMQGLINGITSMIGAVTAKISGLASQVKSAFTTPTQIHSPSRVFIGYGQNLMQGLAIGIDKTADLAIQGTRQVGLGLLNQVPSQLPTPAFMPTENIGWKGLAQKAINKIPMLQPVLNIAKQAQSLFLDEPTAQGFTRLERPVEQYSSTQHGAITVHFNPTIQVNVQNADVQQQVQQGLQMSMYEFETMFNRLMEQQKRRAF